MSSICARILGYTFCQLLTCSGDVDVAMGHRYKEASMYSNRMDLGFPMALVEFLARVGSVMSITLLVLLFQAEALHPSEIAPREWFGLVFFPIGVIVSGDRVVERRIRYLDYAGKFAGFLFRLWLSPGIPRWRLGIRNVCVARVSILFPLGSASCQS